MGNIIKKENMKLSLHSAQYFIPYGDLFCGDGLEMDTFHKMFEKTTGEPVLVKYKCEGTFTDDGETFALRYSEKKTEELSGAETTVVFSHASPDRISVIRRIGRVGSPFAVVENSFLLDAALGYETKYSTEMGDFTMRCICGKVKNTLSFGGGTLILDYISQLEGFDPQRIKMRIEITPSDKGGELGE